MNSLQLVDKTAAFISRSAPGFAHESLVGTLHEIAEAVEAATSPEDKLQLIYKGIIGSISAYRTLSGSLARVCTFLVLALKKDNLYRFDQDYRTVANEPMPEIERFMIWSKYFLRTHTDAPDSLISKIKNYVRRHWDMELIDRVGFEQAVILAKYERLYGDVLETNVPESFYVLAEAPGAQETGDLAGSLDIAYRTESMKRDYVLEHKAPPPPEVLSEFVREAERQREAKSLSYSAARSRDQHRKHVAGPKVTSLRAETAGFTRGAGQETLTLLHGILDFIPQALEVDKDRYLVFIHAQTHCAISGKRADRFDQIEAHHVVTRGARPEGDWGRIAFNLVPVVRSVHREIDQQGLEVVLQKYGQSEFTLPAEAARITMAYLKGLERQLEEQIDRIAV